LRAEQGDSGRRAAGARLYQRRYWYKNHYEVERAKNRTKFRVRSKVEHVLGVMKLKFGFCEGALPTRW
jgi:hypothetical protein